MLLNIVKLRYFDPPSFVDVGQIVSGYTLETSGNLGGQLSSSGAIQGNTLAAGGAARFTDRPTVTYTPLTGDRFLKSLMTPLTPQSVFFTIESGWPADAILFITVSRLNGLKNQQSSIAGLSNCDTNFLRALQLIAKLQAAGAVSMRIDQNKDKAQSTVLTFRTRADTESSQADSRELRDLLGLQQDATEFNLVFGSAAKNDRELAIQTRSLLHILGVLAAQVEVPTEHITQHKAAPGLAQERATSDETIGPRIARIHSSKSKPAESYVAVQYRDYWFWVDDRDLQSKRAFAFMMMLFTLTDSGTKESLPLITIPTQ